jgi:hypothetical protein
MNAYQSLMKMITPKMANKEVFFWIENCNFLLRIIGTANNQKIILIHKILDIRSFNLETRASSSRWMQ